MAVIDLKAGGDDFFTGFFYDPLAESNSLFTEFRDTAVDAKSVILCMKEQQGYRNTVDHNIGCRPEILLKDHSKSQAAEQDTNRRKRPPGLPSQNQQDTGYGFNEYNSISEYHYKRVRQKSIRKVTHHSVYKILEIGDPDNTAG